MLGQTSFHHSFTVRLMGVKGPTHLQGTISEALFSLDAYSSELSSSLASHRHARNGLAKPNNSIVFCMSTAWDALNVVHDKTTLVQRVPL